MNHLDVYEESITNPTFQEGKYQNVYLKEQ